MGMRDQSWCSSCGAGMLYTEDENVTCYRCDQEEYNKLETRSSKFIEYMKLHMISLEQDWEKARNNEPLKDDEYDPSDDYFEGATDAVGHLLSVANDIMNTPIERDK